MKIVITDGYELNPGDLDWKDISQLGTIEYYDTTPKEKIKQRCKDAEIIVTNKTPISSSVIEGSFLKLITVTATGYNNIDLVSAKDAGVVVCNVPEYGTFSVAQHTIALILELVNHVGLHAESVKRGEWETSGRWCYSKKPIVELKDKTLGIVGLGRIGGQVAEIAKVLGMKILFYNRSVTNSPIAKQVSLKDLFVMSDIVSLHCPLNAENAGFVNSSLLSTMKPSALLVNTSRGPLIDEHDLAEAIKNEVVAGAALDVLSTEPPGPDNPLIGLENCIVTPHNAWLSFEARSRIMKITVDNISEFLRGAPQNKVN